MRAARKRVRCIYFVFWALLCTARLAGADPGRRVLLDPGSQASLARKVAAEASQAGLAVSVVEARSITSDDDAAHALAREPGAAAVVTLLAARRVGVYVPSQSSSGLEILSGSADDEDTFPLRIVEHLRARLSALPARRAAEDEPPVPVTPVPVPAAPMAAETTSAVTPVPPETATMTEPSATTAAESGDGARSSSGFAHNDERGFWLEGGGAYGARPGGFESGWRAALGGRYAFDSLSLGAVVLLPLTTSEFREGTSSARAESASFLVKGAVHDHPAGDLGLSGGPGIGLVVQHLRGAAAPPLESRDDTVVSAALFAHGDVSWALAPWLRVAMAVQAGAVVPRIAVRFEGRDVTGTGAWFADALLVARVRLSPSGGER